MEWYKSKNNECVDCGKHICDCAIRCKSCSNIFYPRGNAGKTKPLEEGWKSKLPDCEVCDKKLSRTDAKMCKKCQLQTMKGEDNPNFKGGNSYKKHKCIDCGNKISVTNFYNGQHRCKSCGAKHRLSTPEARNKQWNAIRKALNLKPNKPEKLLNKILYKLFPREYKYVGNGKVLLNGFNPDFINVNGQKKIIERYGDYWHTVKGAKEKDKRRIKTYKKYGYKTLVIWEHELEELDSLLLKLHNFHGRI